VREGEVEALSPRAASWAAFRAMLLRDFTILDKRLVQFVAGTVMQPLMLVFVLAYVFPKIGQEVGGVTSGASRFSSLLMAGLVAQTIIFIGIFTVGTELVRELGVTGEMEDRLLAPTPIALVAVEKIVSGGLQALFGALVVFPIAAFVPATPVFLDVQPLLLLTMTPLACITAAALGLTMGSRFSPDTAAYLFGVVALPLSFLGAIFFTWPSLTPVPVMKWALLANPLVYVSEGFRAALVPSEPHLPLWVIYPAMILFSVVFTVLGIRGLRRRVVT
jgi:ABC-2 type transport system permease protein